MSFGEFEHFAPATLAEACALLAKYQECAKVIAGGTDLLPRMRQRLLEPECLIDLKGIPELRRVDWHERLGLSIGAAVTLAELVASPLVRRRAPLLAQAAGRVAAPPLQNMGTLGGNVCLDTRCAFHNQSRFWRSALEPCLKEGGSVCHVVQSSKRCYAVFQADAACALVALNAAVRLAREGGQRVVPLSEFYSGDGARPLRLEPAEILAEVMVPPTDHWQTAYERLSARAALDFPQIAVAVALSQDEHGRVTGLRIVLNAVASRPVELTEVAGLLVGRRLDDDAIEQAAHAVNAIEPVKNTGVGPRYRRRMARVLLRRALRKLRPVASAA